ncbi:MAG: acetylesterase [Oscillospiraceae bacterium]|nr:acetylesterase [Oscillospiraceae bacterium]
MAFLQCEFGSACLNRNVRFNVYLPGDRAMPGMEPKKPYPTLYLLHGYTGSCFDWTYDTDIGLLADTYGIAVVMPDGENHFYVDDTIRNCRYGEYIGRELVEYTRRLFPLSCKREDTMIGGISMGGYGAMRNGIKYHEVFGHILGISPANIIHELKDATEEPNNVGASRGFYRGVFGDLDTATERDTDIFWLTKKLHAEGVEFPDIYFCCGTNDFLVFPNRRLRDLFAELGIAHTFEEGPGTHDALFFYPHLRNALERLNLEKPPVMENPFWID